MTVFDLNAHAIVQFAGAYRWLSNFYYSDFNFDNKIWPSVEHAYQAYKTTDPIEREIIRNAPTAAAAKALGQRVFMRPGFNDDKIIYMENFVYQKFSQNEGLRDNLLNTKDWWLEEGNTWNDTYWGVCNGSGRNELGRILMDVREYIRSGEVSSVS